MSRMPLQRGHLPGRPGTVLFVACTRLAQVGATPTIRRPGTDTSSYLTYTTLKACEWCDDMPGEHCGTAEGGECHGRG